MKTQIIKLSDTRYMCKKDLKTLYVHCIRTPIPEDFLSGTAYYSGEYVVERDGEAEKIIADSVDEAIEIYESMKYPTGTAASISHVAQTGRGSAQSAGNPAAMPTSSNIPIP